jgi:hypothetical protein
MVVYRLDTGEKKVVDEFGPFDPELQSDGRYVAWNRGEEDTGTAVWVYDTETGETVDLGGTWPSIDDGRVAWLRFLPSREGREVVMVRDLAGGPTTQLTDSRWSDQPPAVNGGHVVWARRNSDSRSSEGRGIFVATAPASSVDTAAPQPVNGGPGTPEYDGIPRPIVDGSTTLPEQMPADFGLVAAYGVWARNVIDTFAHTFAKDLGPSEEKPLTAELTVPLRHSRASTGISSQCRTPGSYSPLRSPPIPIPTTRAPACSSSPM